MKRAVLGVVLLVASAASAAEGDRVAETQLVEAYRAADWERAAGAWERLEREAPEATTEWLRFVAAQAYYELDNLGACDRLLGQLLEGRDDHIEALYLRARVRARQGDLAVAKTLLVASARAGQLVMRDLSAADAKALFGEALDDPEFVLAVMRASSEHQIERRGGLRNPFAQPTGPIVPKVTREERGQVAADLARRIETLLTEIAHHADRRQLDALLPAFTELRGLLDEFEALGFAELERQLRDFQRRFAAHEEVYASLRLHAYITEGNQHLRAMAADLDGGRFDAVLERFDRMESLCERMQGEQRTVFARNAEQLFLRGKALAERARLLKAIDALPLSISGIVIPGPREPGSAIVNDRIVRPGPGSEVVDPDTHAPIPGLQVVRVVRSAVTFRYRDVEFVRPLASAAAQ